MKLSVSISSTSLLATVLCGCAGIEKNAHEVLTSGPQAIALTSEAKNESESDSPPAATKIQPVAFHSPHQASASPAANELTGVNEFALKDTHAELGEVVVDTDIVLSHHPVKLMDVGASNLSRYLSGDLNADFAGFQIEDAVSAEPAMSLADIEQMALANNPSIAIASAAAVKASELRSQVGIRPNPTLGYFGQQIADRNTDQHGIFIEQEFVRGNKLKLNRDVLAHTASAQRWEMETQRHRVLTDVRVRFYEAVAAQQQLLATRDFQAVALRGVQVALDRQEAEEGTLIEVLQSKTLLSETTLAAQRSEVAYRGAWLDLAAIAGLPAKTPVRLAAGMDTPEASPDWENAYAEIVAQSPELSVANALVCEKAALWKRQKVQMVPNITGQLGAGYDNSTDSGMINLQVSAPIPVWNKNSGNISAAYAEYTRAIENVKRIEQGIRSRLARAAQDFDSSIASVQTYKNEIVPQAAKSLELSEEAYKAGELDFLQVLIVRRSFYDSTIRYIEAQGKLAQANARVDGLLLSGGLDAPQDYTSGDGIRGASFGGQ